MQVVFLYELEYNIYYCIMGKKTIISIMPMLKITAGRRTRNWLKTNREIPANADPILISAELPPMGAVRGIRAAECRSPHSTTRAEKRPVRLRLL